jgi:hypothetical protein
MTPYLCQRLKDLVGDGGVNDKMRDSLTRFDNLHSLVMLAVEVEIVVLETQMMNQLFSS